MTVRIALCAVVAAAGLTLAAPPGFAGPCVPEPGSADGRIKFGALGYVGDDWFSVNGAGQTANFATNPVERTGGIWKISFENEKAGPRTIRVGAVLVGDDVSYRARFLRGGNDVTDKALNGDLKFRSVGAGESTTLLTLKMKPRAIAQIGEELDALVQGYYKGQDSCAADVVRAHIELAI